MVGQLCSLFTDYNYILLFSQSIKLKQFLIHSIKNTKLITNTNLVLKQQSQITNIIKL